jgi:signal transduction histidine kinase
VQPFIFITAVHRDNKDMRYGMALGADDYITKPFSEEDLLSSIKSRLKKHTEIKNKFESLRKSIEIALPHELQTPLVSIVGYSNLLIERLKQLNDSEGVEFATIINEAGLRLNRLIQKFITYTKFELRSRNTEGTSPDIASTIIPIDFISDICFKVAERFRRIDDLKLDLRDTSARILIEDFHIILEELLDNAFKFSKPGTEVKLSSYQSINKFYLKVTDHGRGISQEQLSAIEAYRQFERDTYEQQGLGLGLIIVKKIIDYYDGSLTIKSEYGNYTTVEVYLPSTNVFN